MKGVITLPKSSMCSDFTREIEKLVEQLGAGDRLGIGPVEWDDAQISSPYKIYHAGECWPNAELSEGWSFYMKNHEGTPSDYPSATEVAWAANLAGVRKVRGAPIEQHMETKQWVHMVWTILMAARRAAKHEQQNGRDSSAWTAQVATWANEWNSEEMKREEARVARDQKLGLA